jgi:hypothetical protein
MAEYFMGQELIQGELPANSPKPVDTPAEGVIMTDITMDGWKRRYIYIAMSGSTPEEILISETAPNRVSGTAVSMEEPEMGSVATEAPQEVVFTGLPSERRAPVKSVRMTTPFQQPKMAAGVPLARQQAPVQMSVPVHQAAVPVSTISIQKAAPQAPVSIQVAQAPVLGGQVAVPYSQKPVEQMPEMSGGNLRLSNSLDAIKPVSVAPIADVNRMAQAPVTERALPMLGNSSRSLQLTTQEAKRDLYPVSNPIVSGTPMAAGMAQMGGSPSAFMHNQVPLRGLGQAAPAASPEAPPPSGGKCPGAVEMPDGRVIEPEDGVSLKDLCELMPFLVETLTNLQSKGLAPGQKLSVVGQKGAGVAAVPTAAGSFGPAGQGGGPFGSTGGMSFGGGGGGPGPSGPQGPVGAPGATGPGSIVEPPLIKTDGDFIAGPGAFVGVPSTLVPFTMAAAGVAQFNLLATFGDSSGASAGLPQSMQVGLRIDGTDYSLITRLLHTFVGGVGEFLLGQSFNFAMSLGGGPHTVEVLLRGLAPGEFSGNSLGISASICAVPSVPLVLTVSHS